jgi:hypothetical protein
MGIDPGNARQFEKLHTKFALEKSCHPPQIAFSVQKNINIFAQLHFMRSP